MQPCTIGSPEPENQESPCRTVDQTILKIRACEVVGLSASTLRRWRPVDRDTAIEDERPLADPQRPANQYSQAERDRILGVCVISNSTV